MHLVKNEGSFLFGKVEHNGCWEGKQFLWSMFAVEGNVFGKPQHQSIHNFSQQILIRVFIMIAVNTHKKYIPKFLNLKNEKRSGGALGGVDGLGSASW